MVVRVSVRPRLLEWARQRSGRDPEYLASKFPRLPEWEAGESKPTLKQLEEFAQATYTPLGLLLLPEPPSEEVPIPDYRTIANRQLGRPSADLLDTIYICQRRQAWYRDHQLAAGAAALEFVGSLSIGDDIGEAASRIVVATGFDLNDRSRYSSWAAALSSLSERAENLGILVMISGIVGSNTHRPLDPDEFRGFSLVDPLAPVVFVNGADTKAAQIFTLVHELAHVWLGQSALSDVSQTTRDAGVEGWCNRVAAEVLVPTAAFEGDFSLDVPDMPAHLDRLAAKYRVSTLVILGRALDTHAIDTNAFRSLYESELARVLALRAQSAGDSGGNFYFTQPVRTSKRFARAVIESAQEGETAFREAAQLLGFRKLSTLDELGRRLGVA